MRRNRIAVVVSRQHLAATFAMLAVPFMLLLLFARIAHINMQIIFGNILLSGMRLILAYLLALLCAWGAAVTFYRGRRAAVFLPAFDVLQSVPTFTILPFAVTLWGGSDAVVITFLVLTMIWPLFFSVVSSFKLIKREWNDVVQISDLRGWAYVERFLWPASIPGVITGSIIGLGEGWEALVATEIIAGAPGGLGEFFHLHARNAPVTSFGVVAVLAVIFLINKLLWLPLLERSHRTMES